MLLLCYVLVLTHVRAIVFQGGNYGAHWVSSQPRQLSGRGVVWPALHPGGVVLRASHPLLDLLRGCWANPEGASTDGLLSDMIMPCLPCHSWHALNGTGTVASTRFAF